MNYFVFLKSLLSTFIVTYSQVFRDLGYALIASLLLLSLPKQCEAQFTYLEAGVSLNSLTFQPDFLGNNRTGVTSVNLELGILFRPIHYIGVGFDFSIPMSQNSEFSFTNAPLSNGWTYSNSLSEDQEHFAPDELDYRFEIHSRSTLKLRFIMIPKWNLYLELRGSKTKIDEAFTFIRSYKWAEYNEFFTLKYPEVSAEDYHYLKSHELFVPGIGFGMMPRLGPHWFAELEVLFDFYKFPDSGFDYSVSHDIDYSTDLPIYVQFRSQATGSKINMAVKIGFGYFF